MAQDKHDCSTNKENVKVPNPSVRAEAQHLFKEILCHSAALNKQSCWEIQIWEQVSS